jgi:hypothetical protein
MNIYHVPSSTFTLKLMQPKLQAASLAQAPSKFLGGGPNNALEMPRNPTAHI